MLRSDCVHLKKVTSNDIHEGNKGSLRCDVHRAAPDPSSRAGISCPADCMGYRPISSGKNGDANSALDAIKQAFMSLIGQK
ncbi:MAG TPA: hypothetical protein ENN67_02505 [Firmicutes bacterium]|nr:hypothetical protein [Bacillota bacterium]